MRALPQAILAAVFLLAGLVAPAAAAPPTPGPVVDQRAEVPDGLYRFQQDYDSANYNGLGQTVTVGVRGSLVAVDVYLAREEWTTADLVFEIHRDDPSGDILATSDPVPAASVPASDTTGAWVHVTFTTPASLLPGDVIAIATQIPDALPGGEPAGPAWYWAWSDAGAPEPDDYLDGAAWGGSRSYDGSLNWGGPWWDGSDLTFRTWMAAAPTDTTPPVLDLPDNIVVDGMKPAGTFVAFWATAADDVYGDVPVACSPASGTTFRLGTTTVRCTATDPERNSTKGTFTVVVKNASQQLADTRSLVLAYAGEGSDLVTLIDQVRNLVASGRPRLACTGLLSFDEGVRSEIGKTLTPTQATDLLFRSRRIRSVLGCPSASACVVPTAGLTSWWTGDGTVVDRIGRQDATLVGDATYGRGLIGKAFALDGDGDWVDVADDPAINVGTGDLTIGLWVRFNTIAGEQVLAEKYVQRFDEIPSTGWTLTKLESHQIRVDAAEAGIFDSPPLALVAGTWYYVAARRSGTDFTIFVNGVEVASGPAVEGWIGDLSSPSSLKLGHRGSPADTPGSQDESGFFLNGSVDEAQLFAGTALSDADVATVYMAGAAGTCKGP